jgi:hypothetical protein
VTESSYQIIGMEGFGSHAVRCRPQDKSNRKTSNTISIAVHRAISRQNTVDSWILLKRDSLVHEARFYAEQRPDRTTPAAAIVLWDLRYGQSWTLFRGFFPYGGTLASRCRSVMAFQMISTSFRHRGFDPARLQLRLPFFRDLDRDNRDAWVHFKTDNLEAFVDRGGPVKVALFWWPRQITPGTGSASRRGIARAVASLIDLAGMKMRLLQPSTGRNSLRLRPSALAFPGFIERLVLAT